VFEAELEVAEEFGIDPIIGIYNPPNVFYPWGNFDYSLLTDVKVEVREKRRMKTPSTPGQSERPPGR